MLCAIGLSNPYFVGLIARVLCTAFVNTMKRPRRKDNSLNLFGYGFHGGSLSALFAQIMQLYLPSKQKNLPSPSLLKLFCV